MADTVVLATKAERLARVAVIQRRRGASGQRAGPPNVVHRLSVVGDGALSAAVLGPFGVGQPRSALTRGGGRQVRTYFCGRQNLRSPCEIILNFERVPGNTQARFDGIGPRANH